MTLSIYCVGNIKPNKVVHESVVENLSQRVEQYWGLSAFRRVLLKGPSTGSGDLLQQYRSEMNPDLD